MKALDKLDRSVDRLAKKRLNEIDCVETYKSLEGDKKDVLKQMDKWASHGWTCLSFGWANGFQGGWYALMIRHLRGPGAGTWK